MPQILFVFVKPGDYYGQLTAEFAKNMLSDEVYSNPSRELNLHISHERTHLNMKTKDTLIHPEDGNSILYWTKKWGVSRRQLSDAILHTGSVNPVQLKEYLKYDIWYYAPLFGLLRFLKIKL